MESHPTSMRQTERDGYSTIGGLLVMRPSEYQVVEQPNAESHLVFKSMLPMTVR